MSVLFAIAVVLLVIAALGLLVIAVLLALVAFSQGRFW